ERKPARPVAASEHKCSTHNRQELDEFDPDGVVLKRIPRQELGQVVNKADRTHRYIQTSEDRHGEGAFVRIHGSTSNTASLGSSSSACGGRTAPASSSARIVPTKSPVSRCQPFPDPYTAHASAVPAYSRDFNSSAGWNRSISRIISALPLNPAQCSAVAPISPGISTGHPASSISRTAFVLLFCAAFGNFRWSASVSVLAASGCFDRNS